MSDFRLIPDPEGREPVLSPPSSELVYLDHNATTPVAPAVIDGMLPWLRDGFANPSSDHRGGRRARRAIDEAREQTARLVGAEPDEIVFTSGGTESNNLALRGWLSAHPDRPGVITSPQEHPAVVAPCQAWERAGHPVAWVPPRADGRIHPHDLASAWGPRVGLVSFMLANNETGAIQPLAELAAVAHERGATVHSDGAQAVGRIPVDVRALGIDLLSIAGHKLYGPKGIGALVVGRDQQLDPFLLGAGQERGLRPGTENVPGIVGLGIACAIARERIDHDGARLSALTHQLWERLAAGIPGLVRTVEAPHALPNTLHVRFPGRLGRRVLARAHGLAASTGSACHEGVDHPSTVLTAMGLPPEDALSAVRLSLGRGTTERDVQRAADLLIAAVGQLEA